MKILGATPRHDYSPLDALWVEMASSTRHSVTLWGMDRTDGPRYRKDTPLAEVARVIAGGVDAALVADPWQRKGEFWDLRGLDCPIAMVLVDSCVATERKIEWLRDQPLTALLLRIKDDVPRYAQELPDVAVHWLPFGFDPRVFKDWEIPKDYDVAMFGHRGIRNYPVRECARTVLSEQNQFRFADFTHNDPHARVPSGQEYAWQVGRARIVINTSCRFKLVNQKYYEVPACRTALVANEAWNGFDELFDKDRHLRLFSDDCSDLVGLCGWLVDEPKGLKKLTNAGYRHVHANHTNAKRVEQLERIMGWS